MASDVAAGTTPVSTAGAVKPEVCSVVICTHAMERWVQLERSIASIEAQEAGPLEIVVVVDHNPELEERVRTEFPRVTVTSNPDARGVSGSRNAGIKVAGGDVVAFLDDDAMAEPDWLLRLCATYTHPRVVAVGGGVVPLWETAKPWWFPDEFNWVVGCSYRGMPESTAVVRNPIGANMSFRRSVFEDVGLFDASFGRLGLDPAGCDETEFCLRVWRELDGIEIKYQPSARVRHHVPGKRANFKYFVTRCRGEGQSKALLTEVAGSGGTSNERKYVASTLPSGVLRGLLAALKGDRSGAGRAFAIVAGLAATTGSYVRTMGKRRLAGSRARVTEGAS